MNLPSSRVAAYTHSHTNTDTHLIEALPLSFVYSKGPARLSFGVSESMTCCLSDNRAGPLLYTKSFGVSESMTCCLSQSMCPGMLYAMSLGMPCLVVCHVYPVLVSPCLLHMLHVQ